METREKLPLRQILNEMTYAAVLQRGPTSYGAMVPDLPGVFAVGETLDETRELIAGAIRLHIRGLVADNEPIPEPSLSTDLVEIAV